MTGSGKVRFVFIAILAVLVTIPRLASNQVVAWELDAHSSISFKAIDVLPDPLRRVLQVSRDELNEGVREPDLNVVDNHKLYLYVLGRGTPKDSGGAHFALERFAKQAEDMIRAGDSMAKVAFVLGQAAHFIQDLNVPLHTVLGETSEEHLRYERQAYVTDGPAHRAGYRGFLLVKKYKCFAIETAERSSQYVPVALSPTPPRAVIEETWNSAVNDTANLWQSIFYKALGPEKSRELYGIPAPRREVGNGFFC